MFDPAMPDKHVRLFRGKQVSTPTRTALPTRAALAALLPWPPLAAAPAIAAPRSP